MSGEQFLRPILEVWYCCKDPAWLWVTQAKGFTVSVMVPNKHVAMRESILMLQSAIYHNDDSTVHHHNRLVGINHQQISLLKLELKNGRIRLVIFWGLCNSPFSKRSGAFGLSVDIFVNCLVWIRTIVLKHKKIAHLIGDENLQQYRCYLVTGFVRKIYRWRSSHFWKKQGQKW